MEEARELILGLDVGPRLFNWIDEHFDQLQELYEQVLDFHRYNGVCDRASFCAFAILVARVSYIGESTLPDLPPSYYDTDLDIEEGDDAKAC